jgi:alkylation response protein AidB-like acyl-CoA dehydrogenase
MTSRALVKKIVQEKGAEPRLYLFDGERFTDALDGAEERPGERTPAETTPVIVMGVRGTGTAEVKFHDCEVGEEAVVGGVNGGFKVVLDDLNNGRTCVGAIGLGIAQGAIKEAEIYAKRRVAFGTAIINFQVIQHYIASVKAHIEAVRGVVYTAAYYRDKGSDLFPLYAQVAKYLGSRLAVDATRTAM